MSSSISQQQQYLQRHYYSHGHRSIPEEITASSPIASSPSLPTPQPHPKNSIIHNNSNNSPSKTPQQLSRRPSSSSITTNNNNINATTTTPLRPAAGVGATSSSTPLATNTSISASRHQSRTPSQLQQHQSDLNQPTSSRHVTIKSPTSPTSPNSNNNNNNNVRDPSPERECDEYRISPVIVNVHGPLSLRFPGSDYAEVSVPSLNADVLVIASLADSYANGECSLGIPRSFVKNAELDRETGVVTFTVSGVRSFGDSTVILRAQESALDLATKLLWLVTGHSSHASPAPDLVTRAANALHAVAALKQESKKQDRVKAAEFLNERRQNRRKLLQDKWEREERVESESTLTRNQISSPTSNVLNSPLTTYRSVSEIMNSPVNTNVQNSVDDARAAYAEQLRSMLMKNLGGSPMYHHQQQQVPH